MIRSWRQYFAPDGSTPYIVNGEQAEVGKWRVESSGRYLSWWESTGWTTYSMTGEGDHVTWISGHGSAHDPPRMVDGRQLDYQSASPRSVRFPLRRPPPLA